jgi:hypothetical protein
MGAGLVIFIWLILAGIPDWWDYQIQSDWVYYLRNYSSGSESGPKGFFSETEYFAYNPKTHIAYYHFIGID